jgi:hypothetical protein
VQDTHDFDDPSWSDPVQEEVAPAATVPRDMECVETLDDLVSGLGPSHAGAIGKFADRLDEDVAIESSLPGAEIFRRPFQDICEIEFGRSTEANLPAPLGH